MITSFICVLLAAGCSSVATLDRRFFRGHAHDPEGLDEFTVLAAAEIGAPSADATVVKSTAAEAPAPAGKVAPAGDGAMERHVVVARYDEDIAWLKQLPAGYNVTVYQSHDPDGEHFVENYGNEASKYLRYIVDNYDHLPESTMFLQAGRMDWHDPMAKDVLLQSWDWEALSPGGMRSLPTAAPCLIEDSEEDLEAAGRRWALQPGCPGIKEHYPKQMSTLKDVWPDAFQAELGPLPAKWLTHCCAQFQVSRDAIRMHPKDFYDQLFHWTLDHDKALLDEDKTILRNHDPDRKDAGHLMELSWALLFARSAATNVPAPL